MWVTPESKNTGSPTHTGEVWKGHQQVPQMRERNNGGKRNYPTRLQPSHHHWHTRRKNHARKKSFSIIILVKEDEACHYNME